MLKRILEPEVMDTTEEARDYNEMDHSQVNRQFVTDLLAAIPDPGDVLDLGTGTALIPVELCQAHEACRVMAVDLSIAMLDLARFNLELANLTHRIQLDHIDSKQMPYRDGMFDVVMSNSIVHHIPEPLSVLREAVRVTRSGGQLFFRDLARPADLATLEQLVATYAGDENEHQQKMFAESLHAALTVAEVQEMLQALQLPTDTVSITSDRHWTLHVTLPQ